MKPRFPYAGAGESAPESGVTVRREPGLLTSAGREDRACCCPARPVVRAVMPPAPGRPHSVDLLLCGHHYRVSRQALAAAGARIVALSGSVDDAAAALLDVVHPDQAGVLCPPSPRPPGRRQRSASDAVGRLYPTCNHLRQKAAPRRSRPPPRTPGPVTGLPPSVHVPAALIRQSHQCLLNRN